jgi:diaminopimelate epimerase
MHGAGNDFVLLDLLAVSPNLADEEWGQLARRMCDRHFGIGGDGLLLVLPSTVADVRMRMFNPDGSESASCGNGIRCLGRYVRDRHGLGESGLVVETGAGASSITIAADGAVTVDMGRPILNPSAIPVEVAGDTALNVSLNLGHDETLRLGCVSMGNPHAVMFVESEELDKYPLASIGPRVEHHSLFPERTNFEVCEIVTPHLMRVRVWERGAGITLACGTGACASAVVATSAGRVQSPVQVELPGGTLVINWDGSGPVLMTGPAEYVFTGTLPIGRPAQLSEVVHRLEKRELGLVGSAL